MNEIDYIETIEEDLDFEKINENTTGLDLYLDYYGGGFPNNLKFLSVCGEINIKKIPKSVKKLYLTYQIKNPNYSEKEFENLPSLEKLVLMDVRLSYVKLPETLKELILEYNDEKYYNKNFVNCLPKNLESLTLKIYDDKIELPKLPDCLLNVEIILKYSNNLKLEEICELIPLNFNSLFSDPQSDEIVYSFSRD
jgi:hypothetical protein